MWKLILLALAAFFAVILVRALLFRPKEAVKLDQEPVDFDSEAAVKRLQALVRCKTISRRDPAQEDDAEFRKLIDMLPDLYPFVASFCSFRELEDRGLLFLWKGRKHNAPSVMMAHYDVVPVEEENWENPPFEGVLEDGVLWGRGTLDTKVTMNAVLSAADHLISKGFVPEQDVYFAFSGGEETSGPGAVRIIEYFREQGITPALVVDEGGAVVQNVFPGVKEPCGLIGIAEKGMLDLEFCVHSGGGHASAPPPRTPIGRLSHACCTLERKPFPVHLAKPVAEMFDTLGRHSGFGYRLIFANMWCFAWVLDLMGRLKGGEINALQRTTVAFTQMQGSDASNVMPPSASMVANMRLNPMDTVESAVAHIRKIIGDENIQLRILEGTNPSAISQTNCPAWDKVATAVASTWRGCIVSPYLMVQCSDSRHYSGISDYVYRFSAMDLTSEERATIHGNNERIRVETIHRSVEFYIRLMKQC